MRSILQIFVSRALATCIVLMAGASASSWAGTITVVNPLATGAGSLGEALATATAGDTINFDLTYPLVMAVNDLQVTKNLTIVGPGADKLALYASNQYRSFTVAAGVTASISGLTMRNGIQNCGGAIYNLGTLTLSDSIITDNIGGTGGGICNYGSLTLNHSTVSNNQANTQGAGIYNQGTVTVNNSTFNDANHAQQDGGAIASFGALTINNSTFSGNGAYGPNSSRGGAIFSFSTLSVSNSTFYDNFAGSSGGAVWSNAPATLIGATLAGNTATYGGAIYTFNTITVSRSIITNACDGSGSIVSAGDNIVAGGACLSDSSELNDRINLDPILGTLANNGGPMQTMALLAGSPAIDEVRVNAASCTDRDQRGVARPSGIRCDIGAFEVDVDTLFANGFE